MYLTELVCLSYKINLIIISKIYICASTSLYILQRHAEFCLKDEIWKLAQEFLGSTIGYLLWYDMNRIEYYASNNYFIVACALFATVMFLPILCISTLTYRHRLMGGFQRVSRSFGLGCHDVHTKFHEDWFRYSEVNRVWYIDAQTARRHKNIRNLGKGPKALNSCYESRTGLIKGDNINLLARASCIFSMW
jgi:hypothetical protein